MFLWDGMVGWVIGLLSKWVKVFWVWLLRWFWFWKKIILWCIRVVWIVLMVVVFSLLDRVML